MTFLPVGLSGQTHCKQSHPHHTVKFTRFLFKTSQLSILFYIIICWNLSQSGFTSQPIFCSTVYKGTRKTQAYTQPQANPIISFFFEIINASSVFRNPCSLFFFPDIMSRLCLSSETTCSNFLSFRCLFSNPLNHLQAFLWGQLVYSSLYVRYNAPTMHFIIFLRDGFSVCTWVIPQRTLNTVVIQERFDGFTHPL